MTNLTPVYTPAEKIKKLILFGSILVLIGALHYVVLPWVKSTNWYLCNPHGLDYFYRSIGIFPLIFMPFLIAAVPKHLRIIRLKQYPLPEQKTWTAQPYRYGLKATLRSYMALLAIPALCLMTLWTYSIMTDIRAEINPEELQEVRALECKNMDS